MADFGWLSLIAKNAGLKAPIFELYDIPSLKLTYPLKIDPWKRRFLLEMIIFRGYVSFREGNWPDYIVQI